jgi:hypothetical protein
MNDPDLWKLTFREQDLIEHYRAMCEKARLGISGLVKLLAEKEADSDR